MELTENNNTCLDNIYLVYQETKSQETWQFYFDVIPHVRHAFEIVKSFVSIFKAVNHFHKKLHLRCLTGF